MAEYRVLIKELPANERPRERLEIHGAENLSNAELIAIALRTGSPSENAVELATRLLVKFNGLGGVAQAGISELCSVSGIGPAKAAQIKAALELGKRLVRSAVDRHDQISSPTEAADSFMAVMSHEPQEHLRVMLLDSKHHILRMPKVYEGNVSSAMVRVAEVFREAIKENAAALIVAHNHPSGDPTPSPDDVRVTQEIVRAGKMLDIEVLDHLVIGKGCHYSLKEHGQGFND